MEAAAAWALPPLALTEAWALAAAAANFCCTASVLAWDRPAHPLATASEKARAEALATDAALALPLALPWQAAPPLTLT